MTRQADRPDWLPRSKEQRRSAALAMGLLAAGVVAFLLFHFAAADPLVRDYPLLKFQSLFSKRAAYWASQAELLLQVKLFVAMPLIIGGIIGVVGYVIDDPERRGPLIRRGQKSTPGGLNNSLKKHLKIKS